MEYLLTLTEKFGISKQANNILSNQMIFCHSLSSPNCFSILSQASTQTELKIKEAIYINLMKPSLNQQVKHVNLKLSLLFYGFLLYYCLLSSTIYSNSLYICQFSSSNFALRRANVCRNMFVNLKSVVCFFKSIDMLSLH